MKPLFKNKTLKLKIGKFTRGVSLIELLVVIAIFSILAVISTSGVLLSIRGSRKSESVTKVRENLDYSIAVIERQLRNAKSVSCTSATQLDYEDKNYKPTSFSCQSLGSDGYIASASAQLTSDDINVTNCVFTCTIGGDGVPPSVSLDITAEHEGAFGVEDSSVELSTEILLRTY